MHTLHTTPHSEPQGWGNVVELQSLASHCGLDQFVILDHYGIVVYKQTPGLPMFLQEQAS